VKRPDRFPRKSCDQSLMSARGLRLSYVTVKPVRSEVVESLRLISYVIYHIVILEILPDIFF
jgi:hypothetical protein